MKKKEFFELYDKVFLPLGFTKDEEDPLFPYSINLASEESIEENELEPEDIPKLLYGNTGINSGYCIYTGSHFVWLNISEASEALEFAKKITAIEAV